MESDRVDIAVTKFQLSFGMGLFVNLYISRQSLIQNDRIEIEFTITEGALT